VFSPNESEKIVGRILSGVLPVKVKDINQNPHSLLIKKPPRLIQQYSCQIYEESLEEALDYGFYNEDQFMDYLMDNDYWSPESEAKLKELIDSVDKVKVMMYHCGFKENEINENRRILNIIKNDIGDLHNKKHAHDMLSAKGFAENEKQKFLAAMSIYTLSGEPLLSIENYNKFPQFILEQVLYFIVRNRLNETEFRWISRNEPWRGYWSTRKVTGSLFGIPSADLNEEQKNIVTYSSMYDNIAEHPDCPPENILSDDDLLDGWLIIQKQKREKDVNQKMVDNLIGNDKIRNSGEIFIPARSENDIKKIAGNNDQEAQFRKRQRAAALEKQGKVPEALMPDSQLQIRKQFSTMQKEAYGIKDS
jgi:hypothetical protein